MNATLFVYILASKKNGTLYVGVTNDLARRLAEHKAKLVPGFTRRYQVDRLVYFEAFDSILEARARTCAETLAARLEDIAHREPQSGLARPERSIECVTAVCICGPRTSSASRRKGGALHCIRGTPANAELPLSYPG
jgi:predicted GIY-YIG superfamily endonuclease